MSYRPDLPDVLMLAGFWSAVLGAFLPYMPGVLLVGLGSVLASVGWQAAKTSRRP